MTEPKTVKKTAAKSGQVPAKTERPVRGQSRVAGERPSRRSIGDFRDLLSVENMDPEFVYRWILAATESDKRVFDAHRAGWDLVDASKEVGLVIGDFAVGKSEKLGSVYRIPATRRGTEEYMYLVRIPRDYFDEVKAWKQEKVDDIEAAITRSREVGEDTATGQYGSNTIEHAIGSTPTIARR